MTADPDPDDPRTYGLKMTKRRFMALLGGGAAVGSAVAVDDDGDTGTLNAGRMALGQAYKVASDERTWYQGPDSAKGNITGENGDRYSATDTQIEYYWDGGWTALGVGSSGDKAPASHFQSLSTDDLSIGGGGGYLKDRAMVLDTGVTYSDPTTAIENCPVNGTVWIGEGTFGPLTEESAHGNSETIAGGFPNGITIRGMGRGTLIDGGADDGIRIDGVDDITIRDLDVQTDLTGSEADAYHGIWMNHPSKNPQVDNVWVRQANYGGIEYGPGRGGDSPADQWAVVSNCRVQSDCLVHAFGGPTDNQNQLWANLVVESCTGSAFDAQDAGIVVDGLVVDSADGNSNVISATVEGISLSNIFVFNSGTGVPNVFDVSGAATLTNCWSFNSNVSGTRAADFKIRAQGATLTNCHSINPSEVGFWARQDCRLISPFVSGAGVNGIQQDQNESRIIAPEIRGSATWDLRVSGGLAYVRDPLFTGAGNGKAPAGDAARIYWNGVLGGGPLGGVDLSTVTGNDDGEFAVGDGTATGVSARDLARWDAGNTQWDVWNVDTTV